MRDLHTDACCAPHAAAAHDAAAAHGAAAAHDAAAAHHPAAAHHAARPLAAGSLTRSDFLRRTAAAGITVASASVLAACGNSGADGGSLAGTAGASAGTGAAGSGGKASDRVVKVGYLPITDATPLLVAHANGLYDEHGVDVPRPTLLRSWPALAEAFQGGAVDAVHILMPLALQLRFQRSFPAKVIAWNHTNGSALTVRPQVGSVRELAGQTVAIPGWFSIHNVALQMILRAEGLTAIVDGDASRTAKTVKLIVMAPPDMPPALAQGSIAGYIVADPFNAAAELRGIGKILRFSGDVWRDHACCVVAVNERLLDERPDVAAGFLGAVVDAQLATREDPARAAATLTQQRYLPQPDPVVKWALTHSADPAYTRDAAIVHPQWRERRIDFQGYPFPSFTAALIEQLRATVVDGDLSFLDGLDGADAHAQLVDDTLVRRAIEAAGGPRAFGLPPSYRRHEEIVP